MTDTGQMRQAIRILMSAGGEKDIAKAVGHMLQKRLGPTCVVIAKEIPKATKFLEAAQTEPVDIFMIVLNNMIPDASEMFPGTSKPDQPLQIISYLKNKYRKPVIAMAGWRPEGVNIYKDAERAGADYFFVIPPDSDELVANLLRCLGLQATTH